MLEAVLHYKWLLIAVATACVYLVYVRPKLKAKAHKDKGPVYSCDICDDRDCDCHKVDE